MTRAISVVAVVVCLNGYNTVLDKREQAEEQLREQQAELEQERAVIAKEREMQEELRNADRGTVRLQAELEQLRMKLAQENTQKPKTGSEAPDTDNKAQGSSAGTGRE